MSFPVVATTLAAARKQRQNWHNKTVALVPTMGSLHAGHLSLVKHARNHADVVVVSIYVNPTQFGVNEDFDSYPRTLDADLALLAECNVDMVFAPNDSEMYPNGIPVPTKVILPSMADMLCGAKRPGHFDGVGLVVTKLFNIIEPSIAIFGEKDYQQLAIIRQMTADLSFAIKIMGLPTQRAADGLALSSRNQYLSPQERAVAPQLRSALLKLKADLLAAGQVDLALINQAEKNLVMAGFSVDYLEVRQAETLLPANNEDADVVVLVAAFLGQTRLIDNLMFRLV